MIAYIDNRLREWAIWSSMRLDGHFGGAGQFDYDEHAGGMSGVLKNTPADLRCLETEEGVAWLRLEGRQLCDCIVLHYRDHPRWSADMQAQFLRMSLRTYWRRLETSHGLLLGYWIDRACGLLPQTEGLRLARRRLAVEFS